MVTEFPVRERNVAAAPLLIARLDTSQKQDCTTRWIEREQDAHGVTFELNAKLFHVRMCGRFDMIHAGPSKVRAQPAEHLDMCENFCLQGYRTLVEPRGESRAINNGSLFHLHNIPLSMILHAGHIPQV